MSFNLSEIFDKIMKRANDPFEALMIFLIVSSFLFNLQKNTNVKDITEDEVKWLIDEARNCSDDTCIERVVRETVNRVRTKKRIGY